MRHANDTSQSNTWRAVAAAGIGASLLYYAMRNDGARRWITGPAGLALTLGATRRLRSGQQSRLSKKPKEEMSRAILVLQPKADLLSMLTTPRTVAKILPHARTIEPARRQGENSWEITWEDGSVSQVKVSENQSRSEITWELVPERFLLTVRLIEVLHGTKVRLRVRPGGGGLRRALARVGAPLVGAFLSQVLHNIKQMAEIGEVLTVAGQPTGRRAKRVEVAGKIGSMFMRIPQPMQSMTPARGGAR